jgi:hypothetical protein
LDVNPVTFAQLLVRMENVFLSHRLFVEFLRAACPYLSWLKSPLYTAGHRIRPSDSKRWQAMNCLDFTRARLSVVIALSSIVCPSSGTTQSQAEASGSQDTRPVVVTECQGENNCATWTFFKNVGNGKWPSGEEAILQLSMKDNVMTITRTDVTGTKAGLTATYKGTLDHGEVGGSYTSSYRGEEGGGHWYWMIAKNQTNASEGSSSRVRDDKFLQITECEGRNCNVAGSNAVLWTFGGLNGTGAFATGSQPLVLQKLDQNSITVSRTDTSGSWRGSALYTGRIEGDQINGVVKYYSPGQTTPRVDTWTGVFGVLTGGTISVQGSPVTARDVIQGAQDLKTMIELWSFFSQF